MPSASSACASASRGRFCRASASTTTSSRSAPAVSSARRQHSMPASAPCSKPRASICRAAPLPASTVKPGWQRLTSCACVSLAVSSRLTAARTEPLRLVQLEALVGRMAETGFRRRHARRRSRRAPRGRHPHPARAGATSAADGHAATRRLRRLGRALSRRRRCRRGWPRRGARPGSASLCRPAPATRGAARATRPSGRDTARLLARRRVNHRSRASRRCPACPPLGGPQCGSIRPNSLARC